MTDSPDPLDEQTRADLSDAGGSRHASAIAAAVDGVTRSHAGRPLDEIESVLRQAVRDATGDAAELSPQSIERIAQRIYEHGANSRP